MIVSGAACIWEQCNQTCAPHIFRVSTAYGLHAGGKTEKLCYTSDNCFCEVLSSRRQSRSKLSGCKFLTPKKNVYGMTIFLFRCFCFSPHSGKNNNRKQKVDTYFLYFIFIFLFFQHFYFVKFIWNQWKMYEQ